MNKRFNAYAKFLLLIVIVLTFSACESTSTREGTGEFLESAGISTSVKLKILQEKTLNVVRVGVSTFKGVVTLTGSVKTRAAAREAERLAKSVDGVKSVKNKLVIVK